MPHWAWAFDIVNICLGVITLSLAIALKVLESGLKEPNKSVQNLLSGSISFASVFVVAATLQLLERTVSSFDFSRAIPVVIGTFVVMALVFGFIEYIRSLMFWRKATLEQILQGPSKMPVSLSLFAWIYVVAVVVILSLTNQGTGTFGEVLLERTLTWMLPLSLSVACFAIVFEIKNRTAVREKKAELPLATTALVTSSLGTSFALAIVIFEIYCVLNPDRWRPPVYTDPEAS